jgi:hypothetical protein
MLPQVPQLAGSFCVSLQKPLQAVCVPLQLGTHWPLVTPAVTTGWQKVPAAQPEAQAPQLALSCVRSTQRLLQFCDPAGQVALQIPVPLQRKPAAQAMPQPPQLARSTLVLTQDPPQLVVPAGQLVVQVPAVHTLPEAQATLQPPQLARSLCVSTHLPLQATWPCAQVRTQALAWQIWPEGQTVPQAPQLLLSREMSMQLEPQEIWPAGQEIWQTPLLLGPFGLQVKPGAQEKLCVAVVQPPQLLGSVWVLTQVEPQVVRPAAQVSAHWPALQTRPEPHFTPQSPQLLESARVSVHLPVVHCLRVPGQMVVQTPAWQLWPPAQARPQAPQLFTSLRRSTHLVPQRSGVAARQLGAQMPTPVESGLQLVPEAQTVPHLPQFWLSVVKFLQANPPPACGQELGASAPQYFEH